MGRAWRFGWGQRTAGAVRHGAVVAAAMTVSNLMGYFLNVVAARRLGPDGFGALAALLGLVLVGYVPSVAVQTVTTRRLAAARADGRSARLGELAGLAVATSVAVGLLCAVLAVPLSGFLHLASPAAVLAVAGTLVPLTWGGLSSASAGRGSGSCCSPGLFLLAAGGKVLGGSSPSPWCRPNRLARRRGRGGNLGGMRGRLLRRAAAGAHAAGRCTVPPRSAHAVICCWRCSAPNSTSMLVGRYFAARSGCTGSAGRWRRRCRTGSPNSLVIVFAEVGDLLGGLVAPRAPAACSLPLSGAISTVGVVVSATVAMVVGWMRTNGAAARSRHGQVVRRCPARLDAPVWPAREWRPALGAERAGVGCWLALVGGLRPRFGEVSAGCRGPRSTGSGARRNGTPR